MLSSAGDGVSAVSAEPKKRSRNAVARAAAFRLLGAYVQGWTVCLKKPRMAVRPMSRDGRSGFCSRQILSTCVHAGNAKEGICLGRTLYRDDVGGNGQFVTQKSSKQIDKQPLLNNSNYIEYIL